MFVGPEVSAYLRALGWVGQQRIAVALEQNRAVFNFVDLFEICEQ